MEPVFNKQGEPVAWRHRDALFDRSGVPRALIRNRSVYTLDGAFRGRFEDGFYRDPGGKCVAFEEGATGGPLPPTPNHVPTTPKWAELPREPQLEPPVPLRMKPRSWSSLNWDEFLEGRVPAPSS